MSSKKSQWILAQLLQTSLCVFYRSHQFNGNLSQIKELKEKSPNLADMPACIITLEPTEVLQDLGSTRR